MTETEKLRRMFPELKGFEPVETWSTPSYNDGGNLVFIVWEGPEKHYITEYNSWCIEHPDTTLSLVERYLFKEWRFKNLKTQRFGDLA